MLLQRVASVFHDGLPVLIIFTGGILGAVVGWFVGRLLVPDGYFGGIMALVTSPCGMALGLMGGFAVARFLHWAGKKRQSRDLHKRDQGQAQRHSREH